MKQMITLTQHSQLKALSDPLRAEMMVQLIERKYTGQQLADKFDLSRAKMHYHLKILEKNDLIEVVSTEEKNGIMQKFYRSVSKGFTPASELLPHVEEINESFRQILVQLTERTKDYIYSAPEDAFEVKKTGEDPSEWNFIGSTWIVSAKEEEFQSWVRKYFKLMEELRSLSSEAESDPGYKDYYISTMAFKVSEKKE